MMSIRQIKLVKLNIEKIEQDRTEYAGFERFIDTEGKKATESFKDQEGLLKGEIEDEGMLESIKERYNYANLRLDQIQKTLGLLRYFQHHFKEFSERNPSMVDGFNERCGVYLLRINEIQNQVGALFENHIIEEGDLLKDPLIEGRTGDFYDIFLDIIDSKEKLAGIDSLIDLREHLTYAIYGTLNPPSGYVNIDTPHFFSTLKKIFLLGNSYMEEVIEGICNTKHVKEDDYKKNLKLNQTLYNETLHILRETRSFDNLESSKMMRSDLFSQALDTPELFNEIAIQQPGVSFSKEKLIILSNKENQDFIDRFILKEGDEVKMSIGKLKIEGYPNEKGEEHILSKADDPETTYTVYDTVNGEEIRLLVEFPDNRGVRYYKQVTINDGEKDPEITFRDYGVNTEFNTNVGETNFRSKSDKEIALHDFDYPKPKLDEQGNPELDEQGNPKEQKGNHISELIDGKYTNLLSSENIPLGNLIYQYFRSLLNTKELDSGGERLDYLANQCNGVYPKDLEDEIYDFLAEYMEKHNGAWLVKGGPQKTIMMHAIKNELNDFHDPILGVFSKGKQMLTDYKEKYDTIGGDAKKQLKEGLQIQQILMCLETQTDMLSVTEGALISVDPKSEEGIKTINAVEEYVKGGMVGTPPAFLNSLFADQAGADLIKAIKSGKGISVGKDTTGKDNQIIISKEDAITEGQYKIIEQQAKDQIIDSAKRDFMQSVFVGTLEGYETLKPGSVTGDEGFVNDPNYSFMRDYVDITGVGKHNVSDDTYYDIVAISQQIVIQIAITAISGGVGSIVAGAAMSTIGRGVFVLGSLAEATQLASFGQKLWLAYRFSRQSINFAVLASGLPAGTRLLNLGVRTGEMVFNGVAFHMSSTLINDGFIQQNNFGEVRSKMIDMRGNLHSIALISSLGVLKPYMTAGIGKIKRLRPDLPITHLENLDGLKQLLKIGAGGTIVIAGEVLTMFGIDRGFNIAYNDDAATEWSREYFQDNMAFILGLRLSGYFTKRMSIEKDRKNREKILELDKAGMLTYKISVDEKGIMSIDLVDKNNPDKVIIHYYKQSDPNFTEERGLKQQAMSEGTEAIIDSKGNGLAEQYYDKQANSGNEFVSWREVKENHGLNIADRMLKIKALFESEGVEITDELLYECAKIHNEFNVQEFENGVEIWLNKEYSIPKLRLSSMAGKITKLEQIFEALHIDNPAIRKTLRDSLIGDGLLSSMDRKRSQERTKEIDPETKEVAERMGLTNENGPRFYDAVANSKGETETLGGAESPHKSITENIQNASVSDRMQAAQYLLSNRASPNGAEYSMNRKIYPKEIGGITCNTLGEAILATHNLTPIANKKVDFKDVNGITKTVNRYETVSEFNMRKIRILNSVFYQLDGVRSVTNEGNPINHPCTKILLRWYVCSEPLTLKMTNLINKIEERSDNLEPLTEPIEEALSDPSLKENHGLVNALIGSVVTRLTYDLNNTNSVELLKRTLAFAYEISGADRSISDISSIGLFTYASLGYISALCRGGPGIVGLPRELLSKTYHKIVVYNKNKDLERYCEAETRAIEEITKHRDIEIIKEIMEIDPLNEREADRTNRTLEKISAKFIDLSGLVANMFDTLPWRRPEHGDLTRKERKEQQRAEANESRLREVAAQNELRLREAAEKTKRIEDGIKEFGGTIMSQEGLTAKGVPSHKKYPFKIHLYVETTALGGLKRDGGAAETATREKIKAIYSFLVSNGAIKEGEELRIRTYDYKFPPKDPDRISYSELGYIYSGQGDPVFLIEHNIASYEGRVHYNKMGRRDQIINGLNKYHEFMNEMHKEVGFVNFKCEGGLGAKVNKIDYEIGDITVELIKAGDINYDKSNPNSIFSKRDGITYPFLNQVGNIGTGQGREKADGTINYDTYFQFGEKGKNFISHSIQNNVSQQIINAIQRKGGDLIQRWNRRLMKEKGLLTDPGFVQHNIAIKSYEIVDGKVNFTFILTDLDGSGEVVCKHLT